MPPLVAESLRFYWRSHLALLLGTAASVAVLAGALLVGASVRGSLADLAAARLGRTAAVLAAETPFPATLAGRLAPSLDVEPAGLASMLVLEGAVTHPDSSRRAQGVAVYGIDDGFFAFHGVPHRAPAGTDVLLSPALAAELGAAPEEAVIVRVERLSAIPADFLHGDRADRGRSVRLTFRGVLERSAMGEFSLAPVQTAVRAVFLPLARLQAALDQSGRVNTILIGTDGLSGGLRAADVRNRIERAIESADLGLAFEPAATSNAVIVSAASGLVGDHAAAAVAAVAAEANLPVLPVLTWLANRITSGDRFVPYSLVAAIDPARADDPVGRLLGAAPTANEAPIVLNDWAARDLGVGPEDPVRLEYYRWADSGQLVTESADFRLAGIVPMTGLAADRQLAPDYPGITDTQSLADWDPPFPIDLSLVRPADDDYWNRFRTTPKAFIPLAVGQQLWASRHGRVTSLRVRADDPAAAATTLRTTTARAVDPFQSGFSLVDVRAEREAAAGGTTDFGAYFSYFSFFLIAAALLLTGVFFRLTVEQRLAQIGLLRAAGFSLAAIRRLYLREALVVALGGAVLGALLAVGWAGFLLWGLRTWWVGAVNTTDLSLRMDLWSLGAGVIGGLAAAALAVVLVVRGLNRLTPRQLLTGASDLETARATRGATRLALVCGLAAVVLLIATWTGVVPAAAGFFGAGALLLVGGLAAFRVWLSRPRRVVDAERGAVWRLGVANASWRPSRSLAAAGLVATAVFLLVAVDSFRKGSSGEAGTGGFVLFAESTVGIVDDPSTPAGREALGLPAAADGAGPVLDLVPARLRPGDEVGCLNLYRPMRPRVLGVDTARFAATSFEFAASIAGRDAGAAEVWRLLDAPAEDGAVPAIADATSLRYSLHAAVGEVIEIDADTARPIRLRIVAALHDSLLQGELIVSDAAFRTLFPREPGYRMLFVRVPDPTPSRLDELTRQIEERLSPFGVDVERSADRLAAYHRVENTYISTFQTLGGFGLLLGTLGLAAITARNVLERRRELALLGAAGLTRGDLGRLVGAEQATVVAAGIVIGLGASLLAVMPVLLDRGRGIPVLPLVWILVVAAAGAAVALVSARVVRRLPLVASLRGQE